MLCYVLLELNAAQVWHPYKSWLINYTWTKGKSEWIWFRAFSFKTGSGGTFVVSGTGQKRSHLEIKASEAQSHNIFICSIVQQQGRMKCYGYLTWRTLTFTLLFPLAYRKGICTAMLCGIVSSRRLQNSFSTFIVIDFDIVLFFVRHCQGSIKAPEVYYKCTDIYQRWKCENALWH